MKLQLIPARYLRITAYFMNNLPIGVFDSGIGGLTVVRELMEALPNEKIIYFGDTARVPYGNKSPETVLLYTKQIVEFLLSKGVKALLIACNTASAVALEQIRDKIPVPIIGVIKPGARAAAEVTKNGKIGVIATRATVASGLYEDFLLSINPGLRVYQTPCPLFVPLAEEGWFHDPVTEEITARYLKPLLSENIDSLVLGCTHYPLLKDVIGKVAGPSVTLVNPAYEAAKDMKRTLSAQDLVSERTERCTDHEFYVSDSAESFINFANTILPCSVIKTEAVRVADVSDLTSGI